MTNRVLICIGVNQYDDVNLNSLEGAEADAQSLFKILIDPKRGGYDEAKSRLLISPTLADVRKELDDLVKSKPVDTLTLSFAGHGGVSAGSYYFCLRNTALARLSTTALGMPELLSVINELSPQECNIIIDACQAGGVSIDLNTIIKPEILGASSSPSVSILCSSSSNEDAGDTVKGGVGTIEILKALDGQTVVETSNEYLDLVAVGRVVSAQLIAAKEQRPVVWGLNLSGRSRFSRNPCFTSAAGDAAAVDRISQNSEASKIIGTFSDRLLALTLRPPEEINAQPVYALLDEIARALILANEAEAVSKFIIGFAASLTERVRLSDDIFAPVEMIAACCAVLVNLPHSQNVDAGRDEMCRLLFEELSISFDWLAIELDDRSLCDSGFADLYLIPLRIARILGWSAVYIMLAKDFAPQHSERVDTARFIVNTLVALYPLSFSAVNDEQTPYLATFMAEAIRLGWVEESTFVYGSVFSSFCGIGGKIASSSISNEMIAEYIVCRARNDYSTLSYRELAKPSEMLALLLLTSLILAQDDVTDPYLKDIDHLTFNVFIPHQYKDFAGHTIPGVNHSYQIGHGIWTVEDFKKHLPTLIHDASKDASIHERGMQIMCICASFIFPDRCPWFLLLGK